MANDGISVNDGSGLYDNIGLIDTLIIDCNNLPKLLIDNQFVAFCGTIAQMVQKLKNIKEGIEADKKDMERQINDIKREG